MLLTLISFAIKKVLISVHTYLQEIRVKYNILKWVGTKLFLQTI